MKAIYIAGREPDGGPGRLATRPVTEVMSSPVFSVDVDILLGDELEAVAPGRFAQAAEARA